MAYNGWSNYETWAVALWVDNEEGNYQERCRMARLASSPTALANDVKAWVRDAAPDLKATLWADLLDAALSEVGWGEIAEAWWEEEHGEEENG